MLDKPPSCQECSLEKTGIGYSKAVGPLSPNVTFVGEALGSKEAQVGEPFVGPSGVYLNRALGLLGLKREDFRIGNVVHCQPPRDWLSGAPWEQSCIRHCMTNRSIYMYQFHPQVYVTLGVIPTRTILAEVKKITYGGRLENWQGYIIGDEPPYVIPTFHPAHLLRGKQNLMGAFMYAIQQANEVAQRGFSRKPFDLIVDPDPEWFAAWADTITPEAWVAVDTETLEKGDDEEEQDEAVGTIVRINFAIHPDQGITVPWDERYKPTIKRILELSNVKVLWNANFDIEVLHNAGMAMQGVILDGMWAWHFLQSNMPKGLGFVSPYFSDIPPWKHLNKENPGLYAAHDPIQTLRCMFGIAKELAKEGRWDVYLRHFVKFDARVLDPMTSIGLRLNPSKLREFHEDLAKISEALLSKIQIMVPTEMLPLEGGWKTPQPGSFPRTIKKLAYVCTDCGEQDVTAKHKCKK